MQSRFLNETEIEKKLTQLITKMKETGLIDRQIPTDKILEKLLPAILLLFR